MAFPQLSSDIGSALPGNASRNIARYLEIALYFAIAIGKSGCPKPGPRRDCLACPSTFAKGPSQCSVELSAALSTMGEFRGRE
jgi:hypothetical protein